MPSRSRHRSSQSENTEQRSPKKEKDSDPYDRTIVHKDLSNLDSGKSGTYGKEVESMISDSLSRNLSKESSYASSTTSSRGSSRR